MEEIRTERLSELSAPLLSWYAENKKALPWRADATPYHVWVSEIMLQQTRTAAVIPYYERFLRELPTVSALASVSDERLMKLWEGLGYYSRARNLKKAAQILVDSYDAKLPDTLPALLSLPGIGEYTAGAIASIAFGLPEPAVDGNVLRVVMRYLGCRADITSPAVKTQVAAGLRAIYPSGEEAGLFTQAIMELGENLCIPNGEPRCEHCPLRKQCEAKRRGWTGMLPVKSPKKERRKEERTVFLLSCRGRYAVRKRPAGGLLAGLWEFPNVLGKLTPDEAAEYVRTLGTDVLSCEPCAEAVHVFTHVEWHMTGYLAECTSPAENFIWERAQIIRDHYAVPTALRAFMKIMAQDAGETGEG